MTGDTVKEFKAGTSKSRHGLTLGAMLGVFGLWVLLFAGEAVPDRLWLGTLNLVLGAAIALYAWRAGRPSGAQLRVDRRGVWFRDWGATLPWEEIDEVYQSGTRLQPFITLRVRDAASFLASLPEEEARKLRGNRLWKQPELRIPFGAVEATRQEILDAIEAGMERHGRI